VHPNSITKTNIFFILSPFIIKFPTIPWYHYHIKIATPNLISMSQTRDAANAAAIAAKTALQTAADTLFIATVDVLITNTIAQGGFQITANTNKDINVQTVFSYYSNLGYQVSFPDYATWFESNPSNLFGPFWEAFWQYNIANLYIKNPVRMTISWGASRPLPYSEEEV
jgi:hypothetical protein